MYFRPTLMFTCLHRLIEQTTLAKYKSSYPSIKVIITKYSLTLRFVANSSSCTTTELYKLLTNCLIAVRKHVIKYCDKVYERPCKNLFWFIKHSDKVLNKLKPRSFRASRQSMYDFPRFTPHYLIILFLKNLNDLIG